MWRGRWRQDGPAEVALLSGAWVRGWELPPSKLGDPATQALRLQGGAPWDQPALGGTLGRAVSGSEGDGKGRRKAS